VTRGQGDKGRGILTNRYREAKRQEYYVRGQAGKVTWGQGEMLIKYRDTTMQNADTEIQKFRVGWGKTAGNLNR